MRRCAPARTLVDPRQRPCTHAECARCRLPLQTPLSHTHVLARARRGRRYLDEGRGQRSPRSIVERVFSCSWALSFGIVGRVFRYASVSLGMPALFVYYTVPASQTLHADLLRPVGYWGTRNEGHVSNVGDQRLVEPRRCCPILWVVL
jgi:hypothetical protein